MIRPAPTYGKVSHEDIASPDFEQDIPHSTRPEGFDEPPEQQTCYLLLRVIFEDDFSFQKISHQTTGHKVPHHLPQ